LTTNALLDVAQQATGFRPIVQIYDELKGPPNATAINDFEGAGQTGRLLIGYRLLGDILFVENSDLLYAGIVFHELGHLYQFKSGLCEGLVCDDRVIGAELHADFIAGLMLSRGAIAMPPDPVRALVEGWTKMGDKIGEFNRCDAHGTAQQRLLHLQEGLRLGANMTDSFDDLVKVGARAIMSDNPCHQGRCE
jgi:hypothetical protein